MRRARGIPGRMAALSMVLTGLAAASHSCAFVEDTSTVECPSGRRCAAGWTCAAGQDICISDGCGDGFVDQSVGERCDDGNVMAGDSCSPDCKVFVGCGNSGLDPGEICDDGNTMSGDGCSEDCSSDETCGNGYRDVGEACDDGNNVSLDGCSADCSEIDTCGNGTKDPQEICDDGNTDSGDGCSEDCLSLELCRNGYLDLDEECDVGGADATCDGDCTVPMCGDGFFNPEHVVNPDADEDEQYTEACDDGNEENTDDCVEGCREAVCGDAFLHAVSEECDHGSENSDAPNACRSDCTLPRCGDGVVDGEYQEECDDGNDDDTDACVIGCRSAECGDGFVYLGVEECDDGDGNNDDDCPDGLGGTCKPAICGDGFVDRQGFDREDCDPGTGADTASCDADCSAVQCGDRHVNTAAGEECDDGNSNNDDDCPDGPGGMCKRASCGDGFVDREGSDREDCDPGTGTDTATCDDDCSAVDCGDVHVNEAAGEQCEDGNGNNNDNCPDGPEGTCEHAICGDGFVDHESSGGTEECEPATESMDCNSRLCTPPDTLGECTCASAT